MLLGDKHWQKVKKRKKNSDYKINGINKIG